MRRFIIVHMANYENLGSFDNMVELARQVVRTMRSDVAWLNTWWASEDEKLFCEWEAPDRQTLDAVLQQVCDYWPVDDIYEVVWSDPRWYETID